jgi:hypothetical protein
MPNWTALLGAVCEVLKESARGSAAAMGLFTTLQTMCGAAPCLLEARDKGFADIYGSNDEMAGGPRTHCR